MQDIEAPCNTPRGRRSLSTFTASSRPAAPAGRPAPARRGGSPALGGDQRYVASPRVDSYHSIWFELHEDLIQLAGRTREDEVAAGRA